MNLNLRPGSSFEDKKGLRYIVSSVLNDLVKVYIVYGSHEYRDYPLNVSKVRLYELFQQHFIYFPKTIKYSGKLEYELKKKLGYH